MLATAARSVGMMGDLLDWDALKWYNESLQLNAPPVLAHLRGGTPRGWFSRWYASISPIPVQSSRPMIDSGQRSIRTALSLNTARNWGHAGCGRRQGIKTVTAQLLSKGSMLAPTAFRTKCTTVQFPIKWGCCIIATIPRVSIPLIFSLEPRRRTQRTWQRRAEPRRGNDTIVQNLRMMRYEKSAIAMLMGMFPCVNSEKHSASKTRRSIGLSVAKCGNTFLKIGGLPCLSR
jgi:hypothetical protein